MKKFLSLVLALVMTMSLVTISAGAVEYDELTDKDEITYEEAVAVLNRLGIITGYSEGDFRPEGELTRGAAAKIIVSLLIGPDAANNLVATSAPYTDVPVDHTFAAVISYCKNSNIINGYADGSFRPLGTLSGYAFAKMLLGALGYKGENEGGFVGSGWTMNVARLGNEAGLFDRLSFKGNETINREQACQLALNTLKATMVEYSGGMTITAGEATITGGQNRSYKTSNQDYATNISDETAANNSEYWTVEFGEEHFVDLVLEHTEKDPTENDLGQPCTEWSYKKVTIGTYPLTPDFTFTEQATHKETATDASKIRALGLSGYKVEASDDVAIHDEGATAVYVNGDLKGIDKVASIADYTDNGTTVEVYVSNKTADLITHVVVIKTQLMEVRRVASDYVSLQKYDDNDGLDGDNDGLAGFNQDPIDVSVDNVEVDDKCYDFLSGLKADDIVAVIPVAQDYDGANGYDVWDAYTPEKVTGTLGRVSTYGTSSDPTTIGVTVGGTAYKVALWNKDLKDIDAESVQVTRSDVTLHLDRSGNALLAEDVGSTSEYMVLKGFYNSLVNNRQVVIAEGWDMDGNELSLNLGAHGDDLDAEPGDLLKYTNEGTSTTADWKLLDGTANRIYDVNYNLSGTDVNGKYEIRKSNTRIALVGAGENTSEIDSGIKFVYVNFSTDEAKSEVDSISIVKGMQAANNSELSAKRLLDSVHAAQAYTNSDGDVKAVVIKDVSSSALSSNVAYVRNWDGQQDFDRTSNKRLYNYELAGRKTEADSFDPDFDAWTDEKLSVGDFATLISSTLEGYEPYYRMHKVDTLQNRVTSALYNVTVAEVVSSRQGTLRLDPADTTGLNIHDRNVDNLGVGDANSTVRTGSADWLYQGETYYTIDGQRVRVDIQSAKDIETFMTEHDGWYVVISLVFNDSVSNDGFRSSPMVVVKGITNDAPGDWTLDDDNIIPADDALTPEANDALSDAGLQFNNLRQIPAVADSDPALEIQIGETNAGAGDHAGQSPSAAVVTYQTRARTNTIEVDDAEQIVQITAPRAAVNTPATTTPAYDEYVAISACADEAAFNTAKEGSADGKLYKLADAEADTSADDFFTTAENFEEATYVANKDNPTYYKWDATANEGAGAWTNPTFDTETEFNANKTGVYQLKTGKTASDLPADGSGDLSSSDVVEAATWQKVVQPTYYKVVHHDEVTTPAVNTPAVAGVWGVKLTKAQIAAVVTEEQPVFVVTGVTLTFPEVGA